MKRALVTGQRGFVGTHLVHRLEANGWEIDGCDLADGADCRTLFATTTIRYDLVVHCAAVVGGRLTISGDPLAVAVDLELDAALFRWAAHTGQHRIVYFSSSAAYPTYLQGDRHALIEDDISLDVIGRPDLTYGWAKLTGEILARYAEDAGIPVHIFRPFSGYGPDQALDYPFPTYIHRAIRHDPTFHVWGNGRQTRDFIHVDDIVAAVMCAIDQDYRQPVNLGTGRPTSFNELARLVCAPLGYQPDIFHDTSKPVGPVYRVANVERMSKLYVPKVTLEEGIERALEQAAA